MKKLFKLFLVMSIILVSFSYAQEKKEYVKYRVDLTNYHDDLFHVTIYPSGLSGSKKNFNFAATAPGIYRNCDFGRFVKSFDAYDAEENIIAVKKINTNQYEVSNPAAVAKIVYSIEDAADADLKDNRIWPMVGTSIEEGMIIFNTFGVLGYFEELQNAPITLQVDYNEDWSLGTPLKQIGDNLYYADDYDKLADSPILIGDLTKATTYVNDIAVDIYTFAHDTMFSARNIMNIVESTLQSSSDFIGYSPVDNYTFLMCLLPMGMFAKNDNIAGGALEHNQSSLYFLAADPASLSEIQSTMVHEFLHILTPLHAHSEYIHDFNYVDPKPSQHVWFYEGVTEWGCSISRLRGGSYTLDEYLQRFSEYLSNADQFDPNISLCDMGRSSYTDKGRETFINFYNRGAATAAILDLKLLELSGYKKGLRELLMELVREYGVNRPFSEDQFFDIIVEKTYPEIRTFIEKYICGTEPLPIVEYFEKLGLKYIPYKYSDSDTPTLGTNFGLNENMEFIAAGVTDGAEYGLRDGDVLMELFDEKITMQNVRELVDRKNSMVIGDPFKLKIRRNGEEIELNGKLKRRKLRHVFEPMEELNEAQKKLREIWMQNL